MGDGTVPRSPARALSRPCSRRPERFAIENYATCPRRYAYSSIYHFHLEEGAYQLFWQATRETLDVLQKRLDEGKQTGDQEVHS